MLEVMGLVKDYGGARPVNGVSFSVGEREAVGLLGQNGEGKSTTMRMLAGSLAPTAGRVTLDGVDLLESPIAYRRMVGYLPEVPPLYPDMTVREQLGFACALRGVAKRDRAAAIASAMARLDVTDMKDRLIGKLSKGYRQRVGFAAALAGEVRLLILDEPSAGLDPAQTAGMRDLIRELSGRVSILISSHILTEIASVCARVLILSGGAIVADGAQADIEKKYGADAALEICIGGDPELARRAVRSCAGDRGVTERAEAGVTRFVIGNCPDDALAAALFQAVAGERDRLSITRMARQAPSLEDIFLSLTRGGRPDKGGDAR